MRTAQKRDILELIHTLYQAQEEIKKNIESKSYVFAQDMLRQCQECAINIGTAVEHSEGDGFVTVSYIEEYCDTLYHIHEELNDSEDIGANKIYKTLRKCLLKIENSIKNDVPVKKEIVFLPYKASMWDSLESVWMAAAADSECEAYVVPIPYYDKNPNGGFSKEHYEGGEFPPDVPITHYKEYNIANRHPDVIFIHNPYDDNNYVTSVHPSFYAEELKKCCEKLIYIPYYISEEINPNAPEIIQAKSGFVLSSGVLRSDMVIVQSENTKKLYINILEKNFPNINRSYWEQKIQGLGSPKLDRVSRIQRDDEKLPEKWREIIYTKTGRRKKTILYNISIAALLENRDILEKIKDVLDFFKSNQDVSLWWRPHPLYETTIASMRPHLLKEYREITERYKAEGWGIFDEGVDLEWAIAETDAYYGDSSSVVQLYKEAGKPIMIQNALVRVQNEANAEDIPVWPSAFCVDGEDIWFVHGIVNTMMRYNMREEYTYVIGRIPDEVMFRGPLYKGIYKWKNKVFLIPSGAREIAVYDIIKESFEKLSVDHVEEYTGKALFGKIYVKEKYLYCIPFAYEAILRIDMESNHMKYIAIKKIDGTYIGDTTRIGDKIAALYTYTNQALILDLNSNDVLYVHFGNENRRYTNIADIGTNLYLFDKDTHCIVRISEKNYKEEKELCEISGEKVKMTTVSSELLLLNISDKKEMRIIDGDGNNAFYKKEERTIGHNSLSSPFFAGVECDGSILSDKFFYFSRVTYTMYQFRESILERQFDMSMKGNTFENLREQFIYLNDMESDENDIYGLKIWANGLKERRNLKNQQSSNSGEKILQVVKERLNDGSK